MSTFRNGPPARIGSPRRPSIWRVFPSVRTFTSYTWRLACQIRAGPRVSFFCLRDNATDLSRPEEFFACFLVSTYATRPATACPLTYLPSAST